MPSIYEMFHALGRKLLEWRQNEDLACVVFHAESERAFCAGGDVKALVIGLQRDGSVASAAEYFTAEYFVDYLIHVYPKPILCWADGITMGGGLGLMNGASCRVVTERTVMAMPEIGIGLFPDVGGTYFLNRLPAGLGLFLGLTSARISGYDAAAIGMADAIVLSPKKGELFAGLSRLQLERRYAKEQTNAARLSSGSGGTRCVQPVGSSEKGRCDKRTDDQNSR